MGQRRTVVAKTQADYTQLFVKLLDGNPELIIHAAFEAGKYDRDLKEIGPIMARLKAELPRLAAQTRGPEQERWIAEVRKLMRTYDHRMVTVPAAFAAVRICSQRLHNRS
jgi:hypothetical protein